MQSNWPEGLCWALVALVCALPLARSQISCNKNKILNMGPVQMSTGDDTSLPPNQYTDQKFYSTDCHTWTMTGNQYATLGGQDYGCTSETSLVLEFYRLKRSNGQLLVDDPRYIPDVFFFAYNGNLPAMVRIETTGQITAYTQAGSRATPISSALLESDDLAYMYQRPYHRIIIPNGTATSGGLYPVWQFTVQNLARSVAGFSTTIDGYAFRATCLPPDQVPCPRPVLNAGDCGGKAGAVCNRVVSIEALTSATCSCPNGWGNYGCQDAVQSVSANAQQQFSVAKGQWQYFKVTVPPPSQGARESPLIVELTRASPTSQRTDPLLFVKPSTSTDANLPFYYDYSDCSDTRGYELTQSLHYVYTAGSALAKANRTFWIGVLNDVSRFGSQLSASGDFVLSVNSSASGAALCPADCSGRGTCLDTSTSRPSDLYPWGTFSTTPLPAFACRCPKGYGGLLCEGVLKRLPTLPSQASDTDMLYPGRWAYYAMPVDSHVPSEVGVSWVVSDGRTSPMLMSNAILTLDEDQYPAQADATYDTALKRGWDITYARLAVEGDGQNPSSIKIPGTQLHPQSTYIIGLYNSDYTRSIPYSYTLQTGTPTSTNTWLHPYMSVVLGVTAAVVLCLLMTLCKRVMQRRGYMLFGRAPPRGFDTDVAGGAGAVIRIMPRVHAGVPREIIDSFPTFEYVPPPPEAVKGAVAAPVAVGGAAVGGAGAAGAGARRLAHIGSRTDRQALQAAAAEAATEAATAALMAAVEQQQQQAGVPGSVPTASESGAGQGAAAANGGNCSSRPTSPANGASTAARAASAGDPHVIEVDGSAASAAAHAAAAATLAAHHQARGRTTSGDGAAPPGTSAVASPGGSPGAPAPGFTAIAEEEGQGAEDGGRGGLMGADAEGPSCTVCLCEYEAGDQMRRLPCGHDFHRACIDKWMTQHSTCPMCREVLVPPDVQARREQEAAHGGNMAVIYIPQPSAVATVDTGGRHGSSRRSGAGQGQQQQRVFRVFLRPRGGDVPSPAVQEVQLMTVAGGGAGEGQPAAPHAWDGGWTASGGVLPPAPDPAAPAQQQPAPAPQEPVYPPAFVGSNQPQQSHGGATGGARAWGGPVAEESLPAAVITAGPSGPVSPSHSRSPPRYGRSAVVPVPAGRSGGGGAALPPAADMA